MLPVRIHFSKLCAGRWWTYWQTTGQTHNFFKVVDTRLRRGRQGQILRQSQNQTQRRSEGQTGFQETNRSCWCNFYCLSSSPCSSLYSLEICQQAWQSPLGIQLELSQDIFHPHFRTGDKMKCNRVHAMMYLFDTTQLCLNQTFPVSP